MGGVDTVIDPARQGASRVAGDRRRVFLECTSTHASRYNTGIQRASRNIVNASLAMTGPWECTAIIYNGRYFETIDGLSPQAQYASTGPVLVDRLRRAFHRVRTGTVRIAPGAAVRDALHSQRLEYALRRVIHGAQNARRWLRSWGAEASRRIVFRAGDVLVLLDPVWSVDLSRELRRARAAGAQIWVVVNDLIPIARPDLAPEGRPILVEKWLRRTLPHAFGLLCISRAVADEARAYLTTAGVAPTAPRIEHFYLGAGLNDAGPVAAATVALFGQLRGSIYLVVGTIEPRKNHALILDVFDQLWAGGANTNLLIVGRLGWRSHELELRIRGHPQYGRRLHWLEDCTDAELAHAYRNSSALVFVSRCEGFGLPLVEAMQYGLPVVASGIAVFREIGGDYPMYVESDDKRGLLEAVGRFEEALAAKADAPRVARNWLSWADSARMLLEKTTDARVPD
jgi:alpha-1,2-rhamnosyltransferase